MIYECPRQQKYGKASLPGRALQIQWRLAFFVNSAKVLAGAEVQDFASSSAAAFILPLAEIGLLRDLEMCYCCLVPLSLLHWWLNLAELWETQVTFYAKLPVLAPAQGMSKGQHCEDALQPTGHGPPVCSAEAFTWVTLCWLTARQVYWHPSPFLWFTSIWKHLLDVPPLCFCLWLTGSRCQ